MNRALRRTVAAEEAARRERRQRLQLVLKQRMIEAAALAAANAALPQPGATTDVNEKPPAQVIAPPPPPPVDHDDDEDEAIEQQKLLASSTAHWRFLEDSQQAMCIALNRRQTMFAIGEKDGRISIWDNTTMRVITKELDPTQIVLQMDGGDSDEKKPSESGEPAAKRVKMSSNESEDDAAGSIDGNDTMTNDDSASAAGDEDDDDENENDVDTASMEDTESVDENGGDEDEERDDLDEDVQLAEAAASAQRSNTDTDGLVLSTEELKIAKQSLKHVLSIAWSCDSRFLFAGCEEKSTRQGRLCVWDAQSAWLLATFSFDAAINAVSAHPTDPDVVIVCAYNSLPVQLNYRTREQVQLSIPIVNTTLTVTPPPNSRQPSLVVCCRYGMSGRFIYCATSKSTVTILDATTLEVIDVKLLPVLIQFVDLAVDLHETALIFTSSKGVHEFAIVTDHDQTSKPSLRETRVFATGAVRAPWSLCAFSSDGGYIVGMPIVRHRHVGESGLYTWHRATGRVQHNHGVKDGVQSIAWDVRRDAVLVVSCSGAIHVLEDEFTTEWPGTMYPAGFRLVTDNELDVQELEMEEDEAAASAQDPATITSGVPSDDTSSTTVEVFTVVADVDEVEAVLPPVESEVTYIPSIPLPHQLKRHFHHDFHIERHFGLGQSVFEPLKMLMKKPATSDRKKKKKAQPGESLDTDGGPILINNSSNSSKSKSKSKSSKKRRR